MPFSPVAAELNSAEALTDNRRIFRRYLWWEWRTGLLLFALIGIYLEVVLHVSVFHAVSIRIVFPMLFALMLAVLFASLAFSLPPLPSRILTVALTFLETLLAEVQLIYFSIFGNFMPMNLARMGGAAITSFGQQLLFSIRKIIAPMLLLLVPLIAVILLLIFRKAPHYRLRARQLLGSLAVLAVTVALTAGLMLINRSEPFSVYSIFTNVNTSTDVSYKNVGMAATTAQELRFMLLGVEKEEQPRLSGDSLETVRSPRSYSSRSYNVLDELDFAALAETAETPELRELDNYFASVRPTRKNDYTGLLKGYNLITICAESFSPWVISPELTPVLYEMTRTGIIFKNYYGSFQSVTTNGEYTFCMGLYPDMSRSKTDSSFDLSIGHYLPFCLGNALRAEGYSTWAYHNYIGDFYNRNITHPNMGYTFKSVDNGLNIPVDWPSSDLDMMKASVDDYISSSGPFHAYYMTFSGHYQYNWHNAMSAKNRAVAETLPYSMTVQAFIACNLELEYALEYLVDRLEDAGILDRTCIVLTNDHYPYGLTEEEYNELAGQEMDTAFERYRSCFLCYAPGLKENIPVDAYCSTADILPTMLNLLGVKYDSRLLAGTDVLSDGIHLAILADKSFISDRFRFDAGTGAVYPTRETDEISEDLLDQYRVYVDNMFLLSSEILIHDYYAHAFGIESGPAKDTGVIAFEDISDIFQQAGVSFMYRNDYVDPESETVFGGKEPASLGELASVFYRIADRPGGAGSSALPDGYGDRYFRSGKHPYYDAVCWAFETGLLQERDELQNYDDEINYRTIALLIERYARSQGIDVSVDKDELTAAVEAYPQLDTDTLHALIWCHREGFLTGSTGDLEQTLERHDDRVTRAQMCTFLFRFCTYELALNDM